tara:strand:- start:329 stop:802 length:474 start_codon:yes stop_codon:yes gene_type:complete
MKNNYINFYNNLVNLTRNKKIYNEFTNQDTFSDRLIIFLFHFAFFLKIFKSNDLTNKLQNIYDYIFRQLEISIREIGYSDASINKKMKTYINTFHSIINTIDDWEYIDDSSRSKIFESFLRIKKKSKYLPDYFENYRLYLTNNTFNSLLKGVIKLKF